MLKEIVSVCQFCGILGARVTLVNSTRPSNSKACYMLGPAPRRLMACPCALLPPSQMGGVYDVVEISMISRGMMSKTPPYDFVQISYHAISRTAISRRGEMSQPRYLAPLRCRGRDIRGPQRAQAGEWESCAVFYTFRYQRRQSLYSGRPKLLHFVCLQRCAARAAQGCPGAGRRPAAGRRRVARAPPHPAART